MGFMIILLLTPPYSHENTETAISLAQSAIRKNHEVQIHLLMDGVHNANKKINCDESINIDCNYAKEMQELINMGVLVTICPICAQYRGLIETDIIEGASMMNLILFTEKLMFADTFISLGE